MTLQKGSSVLLKVSDGGDPETFTTVGGLENTSFRFSSRIIDTTNMGSNHWRDVFDSGGLRSVSISGNGQFSNSATEQTVRNLAFTNTVRNYEITFGSGDVMTGAFKIVSYARSATSTDEEEYSLTLESSGEITYTEA